MRRRNALPDPDVAADLHELDAALARDPGADPDLAALVADVDAARPALDPAFLASLDARVRAGFPREREAQRPARDPWHVRVRRPRVLLPGVGVALAATAAVLIASGALTQSDPLSGSLGDGTPSAGQESSSSSSSSSASSSSGSATSGADLAATRPRGSAAPALTSTPSAPPPSAPSSALRRVERAAELTLTPAADDVQQTADGVVRETQAAGGYVQRSEVAVRDGGGTAVFTLRIPSARLDDALARLSKLAHVGALTQQATDITASTTSAADRLADARAERQALLKALARATTDRQIASLRARLRDNRSEISARKGALDALRRRADLSTVSVAVEGTGRPQADGGGAWTPRDALHDAGRVLEVAGGVALIGSAVLAPLAVLALLAWLGTRAARRHRRETALDPTA